MRVLSSLFQWVLFVAVPLALGIVLYNWYSSTPAFEIDKLSILEKFSPRYPALYYNFPDGLWAFSLCSAMLILWQGYRGKAKYVWITLTVLLAFGAEFAQKIGFLRGTFDWYDVLSIGLGVLLSFLLLFNWR